VNDRIMVEMGIPEDRNGRFAELFDDDVEGGERVIH
jgi:hypothetical protein